MTSPRGLDRHHTRDHLDTCHLHLCPSLASRTLDLPQRPRSAPCTAFTTPVSLFRHQSTLACAHLRITPSLFPHFLIPLPACQHHDSVFTTRPTRQTTNTPNHRSYDTEVVNGFNAIFSYRGMPGQVSGLPTYATNKPVRLACADAVHCSFFTSLQPKRTIVLPLSGAYATTC